MNKRLILILISTALVLVISVSPVFAWGVTSYKEEQLVLVTDGSNTGQLNTNIRITACTPHINAITAISNDGENSGLVGQNSRFMVDVEQEFILMMRFANTSTQAAFMAHIGTGQVNVTVTTPTYVSVPAYYSGIELKETSGNVTESVRNIGTPTHSNNVIPIAFKWNPEYSYQGGLVVPQACVLHSTIVFSIHTYVDIPGTTSTDALLNFTPFGYAYDVSAVTLAHPTSAECDIVTDFTLANANYNSILLNETLEDVDEKLVYVYNELVRIREAMTTANNWLEDIYERIDQMESYTDTLEAINTSIYQWERLNTLMNIQKYNALNSINPTLTLNINTNNDLNTTFAQNTDDEDQIIQQYMVYVDDVNWNPFTIPVQGDISSQIRASTDWWKQQFTSTFRFLRAFAVIPMYALTLSLALYIIHHRVKS